MPRAPGKFKTKRGGGRRFTHDLHVDENGLAVPRKTGEDDDDDDEDEAEDKVDEEESEEEEEDEQPQLSRAERKAMMKKLNPRGAADSKKQATPATADNDSNEDTPEIQKLSVSDDTKEKAAVATTTSKPPPTSAEATQARKDLERLARIKKEREEAQAKRRAETDIKKKGADY